MPEITVLTIAYNAEKTLRRTVDSILAQSFRNFEYILIDHGSTDRTRQIIRDYEKRDHRIHGIYLNENGINKGDMSYTQRLQLKYFKKSQSGWGLCLDADDQYAPDAMEKMLAFAKKTHCDIVCCGSRFVQAQTGEQFQVRMMPNDLILQSRQDWETQFPIYHQFMRAYWAKLISLDILRDSNFTMDQKKIMGDTGIMFATFESAKTVGFLAEPLYTWYLSGGSTSQTMLTLQRIEFNLYCYTRALSFLKAKCGGVSPCNHDFMQIVFMNELIDSLNILLKSSTMTQVDKLAILQSMFLNEQARELAAQGHLGTQINDETNQMSRKQSLFAAATEWLTSLAEIPDEYAETYFELGEFVSAASENSAAWLSFKKLHAQFLIEQRRIEESIPLIDELTELLPDDEEVQEMARGTQMHSTVKSRNANGCDDEFYKLTEQLRNNSIEQLLTDAASWANKWIDEDYEYYGLLLKWYKSWYRVGTFGQDQGFINYFGGMYNYLKQNVDQMISLYESFADQRSRLTMKTMLQHWMTFHPDLRKSGRECQFEHYFDLDVMQCDENEVFVDCGCFDGGTVKDFIRCYGPRYSHIYAYELTPSTYQIAQKSLAEVERLTLRNAGVSDKNGQFRYLDSGNNEVEASNRLNPNGNAVAKVVKIDDDIPEKITFIKMDIEGAECEALRGAEQQIRNNKPKLAISLYHKLSDLFEIPQIVKSYVPEYKLYLRHYFEGKNEFPFPSEYVLLAVADNTGDTKTYAAPLIQKVDRPQKTVSIVGLGQKMAVLWVHLKQHGYEVKYIIDETGNQRGKNVEVNGAGMPLSAACISVEDYAALLPESKTEIIIVADLSLNFRYPYAEPFYMLKKTGICENIFSVPNEFYICPNKKPFSEWLFQVDMSRGVLDFMQILVTFQCNLNCKGCTNMAELVGQNPAPLEELLFDADEFIAGLETLSKHFWQISRFRFSGGEPLLHPELPRLVREVRRIFPYTEMAVITNALLLLKDPSKYDALLAACQETDCVLAISSYKPVHSRKAEIDKILNQYGVKYYWQGWQVPIEKWRTKRLLHPTGDPQLQYAIAADEQVNALLHEGYLYASGDSIAMQRIFERFGLDTTEMMKFMESARIKLDKLNQFADWTDIMTWIKSPNDMCRYWGKTAPGSEDGFCWFDYELIPPSKIKLGDYLMIDTTEEEKAMKLLSARKTENGIFATE